MKKLFIFVLSWIAYLPMSMAGGYISNPTADNVAQTPASIAVGADGTILNSESVLTSSGSVIINSTSPVAATNVLLVNEQGGDAILRLTEEGALYVSSIAAPSTSEHILVSTFVRVAASMMIVGRGGIPFNTLGYNANQVGLIIDTVGSQIAELGIFNTNTRKGHLQCSGDDCTVRSSDGSLNVEAAQTLNFESNNDPVFYMDTTRGVWTPKQVTTSSTMTITGNAFSVGSSTLTISGGWVNVGDDLGVGDALTAIGSMTVSGLARLPTIVGPTTQSSSWTALGNVTVSTSQVVTGQFLPAGGIGGTTAAGNADAGDVGEYVSGSLGGAFTPVTDVFVSIATITLTAGDWDVIGMCAAGFGGTTTSTERYCTVSSTANGTDSGASTGVNSGLSSVSTNEHTVTMRRRVNISSSADYYLTARIASSTIGGMTWTTNSNINARRIR